MKVLVLIFASVIASAYSRHIVVRDISPDEKEISPEEKEISPEENEVQQLLEDPTPLDPMEASVDPTSIQPVSDDQGDFFSNIFSKAGNIAADTADTAGKIAKTVVDVPASLISNSFSEAGKGAAAAFRYAGNAAARAASDVENGFKKIFSG